MPRSGVTGDFGSLAAWERAFRSAPKTLQEMAQPMAEEVLGLVQEGFAKEQNPYGEPWAPKAIPDGRSILVGKTARLRRGWHVKRAGKSGFMVAPSVDYAGLHQNPTKKRIKAKNGKALAFSGGGATMFRRSVKPPPQRMMVPVSARGLPREWSQAMAEVAIDVIRARIQPKRAARSKGRPSAGRGFAAGKLIGLKRRFNAIALMKRVVREISG